MTDGIEREGRTLISEVDCRSDFGGLTRGSSFKWDWELPSDIQVKTKKKKAMARGMGLTAPSGIHRWKSSVKCVLGTCEGVDIFTGGLRPVVGKA